MSAFFWICLFLVFFVYAGYPILLAVGIFGRRRPVRRACVLPDLSIVVPAHNEEKTIQMKLDNLLALDYPKDKVEILVGSDGSTDRTESIVRGYADRGVRLVSSLGRRGKSSIQNEIVDLSGGSVLVFTDADCLLSADALLLMTQNLADPEVALVTSCAVISNKGETGVAESEGLYWRYERWLRLQESERGLLAMGSGSLFVMRREFWTRLDPNVGDDFVLPLQVARAGYRNVLETQTSTSTRLTQNRFDSMLRMKMRIISKDLRGLLQNSACLNPLKTGTLACSLWSHKLLRWAVPYFLIGLFVSNLFLAGHEPYAAFLVAQVLFLALSVAGVFFGERRFRFPLSVVSSFCLVNLAALLGTLHCMLFRTAGHWNTVR
jgi:cellulose synthase/poly-beta-1,6-N-acetylglucosamine synthase-like glycosyltransferase